MRGGAVLSNLFNYSTNETVIGTFNGKPLYRKVTISTNTNSLNTGVKNVDALLRMEMTVRQNNSSSWRNIPWLFTHNDTLGTAAWGGGFYLNGTTGDVYFQVGTNLGDVNKVVLVMEYTKTTD